MNLGKSLVVTLLAFVMIALKCYSQDEGKATYYNRNATGCRTASGTRFHNDSLFCAHKTYAFGTMLLVKNPANGKEVVVKVVDRGPYGKGRIIDLSYEAAKRIGIISKGVAMVEVSVVKGPRGVPYPADEYNIPELSLEVNPGAGFIPVWQNKKNRK